MFTHKKRTMTKRDILYMSLTLFALNVYAQDDRAFGTKAETKNSFYLGYGIGSIYAFGASNFYVTTYPFRYGEFEKEPYCTGVFTAGYHGKATKRLSLSATLAFENIKVKEDELIIYAGNYLSILGGIKWKYGKAQRKTSFYGRFDIGLLISADITPESGKVHTEMTLPTLAIQISPFCIRYGGKMGGFCEFGFGSLGIVNAGLDYRF